MKALLVTTWLFVPLVVLAYHYGPGQDRLRLDRVQDQLAVAREHVAAEEHAEAVEAFEAALRSLPAANVAEARAIRLEKAKSQLLACGLPDARAGLLELLEELEADPAADSALLDDTRLALASAHYYTTWLMRLEGQPRDVWEPEVDAARQHYRLLTDKAGDGEARPARERDLAAAVKLARMDLSELQGLPLPSQ
jgi:tetratricopeptide (TPR) repeat protein